jgi:hypothetical protein
MRRQSVGSAEYPHRRIVCFQPFGKINGRGSEYPHLIPPSGNPLVEAKLIISGWTDRCEAYAARGCGATTR